MLLVPIDYYAKNISAPSESNFLHHPESVTMIVDRCRSVTSQTPAGDGTLALSALLRHRF
jgi:hypothetical protein